MESVPTEQMETEAVGVDGSVEASVHEDVAGSGADMEVIHTDGAVGTEDGGVVIEPELVPDGEVGFPKTGMEVADPIDLEVVSSSQSVEPVKGFAGGGAILSGMDVPPSGFVPIDLGGVPIGYVRPNMPKGQAVQAGGVDIGSAGNRAESRPDDAPDKQAERVRALEEHTTAYDRDVRITEESFQSQKTALELEYLSKPRDGEFDRKLEDMTQNRDRRLAELKESDHAAKAETQKKLLPALIYTEKHKTYQKSRGHKHACGQNNREY